jgi:hypothetical protein
MAAAFIKTSQRCRTYRMIVQGRWMVTSFDAATPVPPAARRAPRPARRTMPVRSEA